MTVQELIDELNQYQNKNEEINLFDCDDEVQLRMTEIYPYTDGRFNWCRIEMEHV